MKALLDTCVISELITKLPNPKVVEFVDALDPEDVYLSAITIGEIVKGIEKLPSSRRKVNLHSWLKENLLIRFDEKIVALDKNVLVEWGILAAKLESVGKPMPVMDSLIAASVRANRMTLITCNVADFKGADLEIVNPWA